MGFGCSNVKLNLSIFSKKRIIFQVLLAELLDVHVWSQVTSIPLRIVGSHTVIATVMAVMLFLGQESLMGLSPIHISYNSEFSFSYTAWHIKTRKSSQSSYLTHRWEKWISIFTKGICAKGNIKTQRDSNTNRRFLFVANLAFWPLYLAIYSFIQMK